MALKDYLPSPSFSWEGMSGTSKQKYGASLYDDKEMKKWQKWLLKR